MIRGLAVPYNSFSSCEIGRPPLLEVIQQGAFARAVETGRSVKTGKPIFACWGHSRDGRSKKDWIIGDTSDGRLRLFETPQGVFFELDGTALPLDFTGVSIKLEPGRRVRESWMARRIVEAGIRHVAILTAPDAPIYEQTFLETLRRTSPVGRYG